MHRGDFLGRWPLALSCFLLIGYGAAPAQQAEKKHDAHADHSHAHYEGSVLKPEGGFSDEKFDMSNKGDVKRLLDALEHGQVESLHLHRDVNILDISADLGLWTLVIFILLLFILRKTAWQPMLDGLRKREENIRSAAEDARLARDETVKVRADFEAQLAKAHEEIPAILEKARRDAQLLAEELRSKAQVEIQSDRQRLRSEIQLARDQALEAIWTQAADLATQISSKVLRRAVTDEDHRRLVNDALAELRSSGQQQADSVSSMRA